MTERRKLLTERLPTPPRSVAAIKVSEARVHAMHGSPYFGTAILRMPLVESDEVDTFAVTRHGVIYWSPRFAERTPVRELAGVLVHEWLHVLFEHFERLGNRNPRLWNIATDLAINYIVELGTLKLPASALRASEFQFPPDLSAEEYYALLVKLQQEQQGEAPPDGPVDEGGGGPPGEPPRRKPRRDSRGRVLVDDIGRDPSEVASGWCGSGAGRPLPKEPVPDENTPTLTPDERVMQQRAFASAMKQALERQQQAGRAPAWMQRWIEEMLRPPRVNWRKRLATLVRYAVQWRPGVVKRTYQTLSRRQAGLGYGPGTPRLAGYRRPVPTIALVIDTSGSMSEGELRLAVEEAAGILRAVSGTILFLAVDCKADKVHSVSNVQELVRHLVGGGGTDFGVAFDVLDKHVPRPEVVIYATDGQGPAPAAPPRDMRVIWLLVGKHATQPEFPQGVSPWGDIVRVED